MRFLFASLAASLTLLACSCTKEPRPLRLDFIGSGRFTSGNRTAGPGDTLSARLYAAVDTANEAGLRRFQVSVTYEPGADPRLYPVAGAPAARVPAKSTLLYLDSTLTTQGLRQLVYQTTFGARTTSGRETWEFTVTDTNGESAARRFQVRVANRDSLTTYHEYLLRIPAAPARPARPFVALLPGLALPASALRPASARTSRDLIDLVYRPGATSLTIYERHAPADDPARGAQLLPTALDSAAFLRLSTPALVAGVFGARRPTSPALTTGPLRRAQVVAFRTVDGHAGVFIVRRIVQTPYPLLELLVRVTKVPG